MRRRIYLLSSILASVAAVGILVKIRLEQTAKLETLFTEIDAVATKGAPLKQQFMKLARENPRTLPEYLQRCAELEPVIDDYSASEQQLEDLLIQVQQQIGQLKPQGSYGKMLPMLGVMQRIAGKDLEGAKFYKQEVADAKQLPGMSERNRIQFYNTSILPVLQQEQQIALDELAIMKNAKAHGIAMPENMLQNYGLN